MNQIGADRMLASPDDEDEGEGVWAPDIERAFHEALVEYPVCGRRKHILQEEGGGKMYGRNELIARYIYLKTGKIRSRKQVSSHIQVLARRKAKMDNSLAGGGSDAASNGSPSPANSRSLSAGSSTSSTALHHLTSHGAAERHPHWPTVAHPYQHPQQTQSQHPNAISTKQQEAAAAWPPSQSLWPLDDRPLASQRFRLVEFAAFVERPFAVSSPSIHQPPHWPPEQDPQYQAHHNHLAKHRHNYVQVDYSRPHHQAAGPSKLERIAVGQVQDKFPELASLSQRCPSDAIYLIKFWADLTPPTTTNPAHLYNRPHELGANSTDYEDLDDQNSCFGFSSHFESLEPLGELSCSTRACSYGQQVVEQVDRMRPNYNLATGRYSYAINRSPMCEFMIQFIKKLRRLPRVAQMNSVLENFTIVQVITSESTSEVLLCLALIFEIDSTNQIGPKHHVYKLTKD